jgi:N utilization substance protein A
MKSEFLLAFNEVCSDRGLPREVVLEAVETALVSAYRRSTDLNDVENITAEIDPNSGEARILVDKEVVEEVSDPQWEIELSQARTIDPNAELGDFVSVEDTPANFGRIAAQTAKQVILQRIREAERNAQYEQYAQQEGEIVHGVVQSLRPKVVMLNLGSAEAILPRSQQVPGEQYHIHQRLRAYVLEVRNTNRGPKIVLSRSHPNMLRRLLELEVPEIYNGTVEIKSIAREAGSRSKVAVSARQPGVDPVGACVGMRGVRIKSIVNELGGEKIDVIEWDANPGTFIAKALSPSRVLSVQLDEDEDGRRSASVIVPDDQLSLAIGRAGQNARLAAKLCDYRIDIQGVTEAATWALKQVNEDEDVLPNLGPAAEMLPSVANILQQHEEEGMPYASDELLRMRQVVEAVWRHYASTRKAERERRLAEEAARQEALEEARETIPDKAYEVTLGDMELDTRVTNRLQEVDLTSAGNMMELLAIEGDEGLLDLPGIGPKTLEEVKESLDALDLPDTEAPAEAAEAEELIEEDLEEEYDIEPQVAEAVEAIPEAELAPEVIEEAAEEIEATVEEEVIPTEAAVEEIEEPEVEVEEPEAVEEAVEETVEEAEPEEEKPAEEEEPEHRFEDRQEKQDREERLKWERTRRVQLIYDEETGELIPRHRRKREEEEWEQYIDY